jgi:hypothetical protein
MNNPSVGKTGGCQKKENLIGVNIRQECEIHDNGDIQELLKHCAFFLDLAFPAVVTRLFRLQ